MAKRGRQLAEDREFQKEWEDSLRVSSYADKILEAMQSGQNVQEGIVPNYSGGAAASNVDNESNTLFSIDPNKNDYLFQTAAASLGVGGLKTASDPRQAQAQAPAEKTAQAQPQSPPRPQLKLSQNQLKALKKYPALIEFLGSNKGDQIAKNVVAQVNQLLVAKVAENTKQAHKSAHAVEASGQNMKAYFVGDDDEGKWVCCAIASGPFRGDEAIYYKASEDKSYVLRKSGEDWKNVTPDFNVVHEFAREGD